jgi:hypothetical protein
MPCISFIYFPCARGYCNFNLIICDKKKSLVPGSIYVECGHDVKIRVIFRKIKGIFMICGCSLVHVRYVLTAVPVTISIFCNLVPCSRVHKSAILKKPAVCILRIGGGGRRFLRNVIPYLPGYTMYITEDSNVHPLVQSSRENSWLNFQFLPPPPEDKNFQLSESIFLEMRVLHN